MIKQILIFILLLTIISCKSTKTMSSGNTKTNTILTDSMSSDNDGVADYMDMESNTTSGVVVDTKGTYIGVKDNPIDTPMDIPIININIDNKVQISKEYSNGLIAYKVPKEMQVGYSYLIKIRITKENNTTLLIVGDRKIPIADEGNSVVNIEDISISPVMSATLYTTKGSFKVDTLSTEYQNISKKGYTEWVWNIVPLKGGNNLIKLSVKIRVKEDAETYFKDITVFDKKILIKSNIKFSIITWLSTYWQYLLTVILIPIIKFAYEKFKKKDV